MGGVKIVASGESKLDEFTEAISIVSSTIRVQKVGKKIIESSLEYDSFKI